MVDPKDPILQQIAFSKARGISGATARQILERIGGVSNFFEFSQAELHNLTGINSEIFGDAYRRQLLEESEADAANIRQNHIDLMFVDTEDYPQRLSNCEDAPVILNHLGSCDLDASHVIGIVGTRTASAYGVDFTRNLVADLASKLDDVVIVSGLAYGIDIAAHQASIDNKVPTVAVLAHGLQQIYPAQHRSIAATMTKNGGALVTEYLYSTTPHRNHFLARNRIIAGLSDCIVIVESDFRGGSMATARMAMQYDREVFAVPGRVNDRNSHGTNKLIANHTAALIQKADDIIEYMGWASKEVTAEEGPQLFRPLTTDETLIINHIKDNPDATINDICVHLGKSYSLVNDILFQLEMDDLIITLPGGRYAPTTKI